MVGSGGLVAVRHGGLLTREDGAVVVQVVLEPGGVSDLQLEVLAGVLVGQVHRLRGGVDDRYHPQVVPRLPGDVARGPRLQDARDRLQHAKTQIARCGDEDGGGGGAVLRLGEQVDGHRVGVGGVVGDDQHLRGSGQQVDPHTAEQLSLRLCHEGVAGTDDHVDGAQAVEGAVGHGAHRLDASQGVDLVGARLVHGVQRRWVDAAVGGGCGHGHDVLHPGDLCGEDAHECRGDERIPSPRDVRAHRTHREQTVAQHLPWGNFHLDGPQARELGPREFRHVAMGGVDVVAEFLVHVRGGGSDAPVVDAETQRVVVVEGSGEVPDRCFTPVGNVGQHFGHPFLHGDVRRGPALAAVLEVLRHGGVARWTA